MTMKHITPFIVLPVILAITLGGCSKKDGDKAATQVVAKVNGAEISLHQVNHVLSKAGNVPADQLERARKAAVDRLINHEAELYSRLRLLRQRRRGKTSITDRTCSSFRSDGTC